MVQYNKVRILTNSNHTAVTAVCDHIDIVELLIDKGADIGAKDNRVKTALMYEESLDKNEIVDLLKEREQKIRKNYIKAGGK